MESGVNQEKSSKGLKQVKVDNWGTFFLQRLQQMYFDGQFVDLKIKFPTSGIIVQVHRLVVTTCTDYFIQLEQQQKEKDEESFDGILMPSDMPYECVKSIITFMYTGQLEYWTSEQHALYRTAEKMSMTVLTKLLDAQFNSSGSSTDTAAKTATRPVAAATKPVTATPKLVSGSTSSASTLSGQPLPGRKLPIWKRKLDDRMNYEVRTFHSTSSSHKPQEVTPGPSRFDLPEAEDITLGVFSAFDDISYHTKLIQASDTYKKGESSSGKHSPDRDGKNDSEDDEEDEGHENEKSSRDANSDDDWSVTKSSQRSQNEPSAKRGRFDLEEKENMEKSNRSSAEDSLNNHANIIREVLKKYPHLVKNNKNIRLKIMQKEAKVSKDSNTPVKTKVSYVVMKSDHLLSSNEESDSKCNGNIDGGETGPWKCNKCDLDEEYTNYYMYRRHMQDVHEEKFDPRVCEHCGYKATKRNMLMYHLYTKHNVPPPKSMYFPKCQACSYVALSETLLVRHQINHDHRPASRHHSLLPEDIRCGQCNQTFRTFTELTTHELNTRHGSGKESSKSHRCPYCGKTFVRLTNLQVHLDCVHKELHRDRDAESAPSTPAIPLEPSSEAEALSHVASGIAASLGVGDTETVPEAQVEEVTMVKTTGDTQYIVPGMDLDDMTHNISYSEHELEGQHMIMLVNNENYQHAESDHHQQPQQLDIADNEQIVMQGTDDGMIVYIHGAEEANHRSYESYQSAEVTQETEEIVEEVVEEVEEEVVEEEEEEEEELEELEEELEQEVPRNMLEDDATNQDQVEVIQYVEEQTEIVEYDEDQCSEQSSSMDESQEAVMIIEEEHVEGEEVPETAAEKRHKKVRCFTEWNDDNAGMTR